MVAIGLDFGCRMGHIDSVRRPREVVTTASQLSQSTICDVGVLSALADWRPDGDDPHRRIDVFVRCDDSFANRTDLGALAAAGLDVGFFDGERVTGSIALSDLDALAAVPGVERISASAHTHLHLDRSMGEIKATALRAESPPYDAGGLEGWTGSGVIVGVLDNRLTVTHPTFNVPAATPPQTRIIGYWDQFTTPAPGQKSPTASGQSPGFNYGIWWDEAAVADVVARNQVNAIFNPSLYDHGTHVAGIAAGSGAGKDGPFAPFTFVGVAPEAEVLFANSAALVSTRAVRDAVALFFEIASRRGDEGVPCVINMSFGTHEGARDGSSELELALDRLMHDANGNPIPGRAIVVSAGNEANERRHSRKTIAAFANASFRLEVETVGSGETAIESDNTDDQLYFWHDGAARIEVRVRPPRMNFSGWIQQGQTGHISAGPAEIVTIVSPPAPDPANGKRNIGVTLKAPVRKGTWTIELHETGGTEATVDVWVERENNDVWPRFAASDNVIDNTVTSPSTARSVVAVGAYISEPGEDFSRYGAIAAFSSRGLDSSNGVTPDRVRPHLVAPGRRIISAGTSQELYPKDIRGRFNGWLLGRHVSFSGTSQAAPHVTGVVALMFEKNPKLTYRDVQRILAASTKKDHIPTGLVLPNAVWGAGKLDAQAALAATPTP